MNQEIKDRIFAVADELFAASGAGHFPSVEAVRQKSRANMNYVVEALKEWRQQQRKTIQVAREPLPEILHESIIGLGHSIWETAQKLAGESLETIKAAFETEKADLNKLLLEQSNAFEKLRAELEATDNRCIALDARCERTEAEAGEMKTQLAVALEDAGIAKLRVIEIEKRTEDLKAELVHAHEIADTERHTHQERLQKMHVEFAGLMQKAESERDAARSELNLMREEFAKVRGELEAVKVQNVALLATLKPVERNKKSAASIRS